VAYDEVLADRIRSQLDEVEGRSERKMFGGIAFMLNGNMVVGIAGQDLMVRVGAERYAELLALPGAREMDFTGRTMRGFVFVEAAAIAEDDDLGKWLDRALDFVGSLPPK
jgi:TfoX/Sxy family transcriptional regulator of competence genes